MTTQSQVEEQVIAEWLSLEGYFVETNIGLPGNKEADVIAVKVEDGQVIVRHVEVGVLDQSYQVNLSTVQDKFPEKNRTVIKEFVTERISLPEKFELDYRCEYVFSSLSNIQVPKLTQALAKDDIEIISLDTILFEKIPLTMREWREKKVESGRVGKKKDPQSVKIPRKYRILYIVDRLTELWNGFIDQLITTSGGSITPSEVEEVLSRYLKK